MLILLSPAKNLDFTPTDVTLCSEPEHLDDTDKLIGTLSKKSVKSVARLMSLSDKLAQLNVDRYRSYQRPFKLNDGAKQSLLAFNGDVYRDWPLHEYANDDLEYAQAHLRILSGLYGVLRPLDLIRPYRLEMGTPLRTRRGKNLYQFWGKRITHALNGALEAQGDNLVVNLASNEYFSSVQTKHLDASVASPVFKDYKNGKYKIISFFAKRARGMMAHYLIKNRVGSLDGLQGFNFEGYRYDPKGSTAEAPLFLRKA